MHTPANRQDTSGSPVYAGITGVSRSSTMAISAMTDIDLIMYLFRKAVAEDYDRYVQQKTGYTYWQLRDKKLAKMLKPVIPPGAKLALTVNMATARV